jgi:hypothetical protein
MGEMRKVTVHLPEELLSAVQAGTGTGITETLREALEALRERQALQQIRALRGKVKFGVDLMALREQED